MCDISVELFDVSIQLISLASREQKSDVVAFAHNYVSIQLISLASRETKSPKRSTKNY